MQFLKLLLISIFLLAIASGQNYKKVKIYLDNKSAVSTLIERGIALDHYSVEKDNSITAFISDKEFSILNSTGFNYDVLIDDWFEYYSNLPKLNEAEIHSIKETSKTEFGVEGFGFGSMGGFYTFQEAIAQLDSMYAHFPNLITQKFSIGTTIEGKQIWAVKISDNPNVNEDEPAVGFDALIHAREPQSMETLIYFMYYLLENYGTNPEVTYLVNNREIYCVPVFNPDGYEYNRSTNPTGGGMWRKNRRNNGGSFGVDLNRNFSYKWGYDNIGSSSTPSADDYRGTAPFSEPEAQAVSQFFASKNIKTHFNMHSWQDAFLYPWGYINALTPDSLTYQEFASDMSVYNGYAYGNSSQILGYPSNGSVRDWMYGEQNTKNKIYGYTVEIGNSSDGFWPPQSRIFPIAQMNVKVLMYQSWVAGEYPTLQSPNFTQQYFNPGNFVQFQPSVKNKGLSTANNVSVVLTSLGSYATVNNNTIIIDSIPARTVVSAVNALSFTVASNAPAEQPINLLFTTSLGGTEIRRDTIKLIVGIPEYVFVDTTNNPLTFWTITATPSTPKWEATTSAFYSSPSCYTDSKLGNYANNATVTMTLTDPIDLSSYTNPKLSFWTKYDIENNWDYGQVEVSTNNGSSWTPLTGNYTNSGTGTFQPNGQPLYDGTQLSWVREVLSLSGYTGSQVKLRFKLKTDGSLQKDGWYVDDIGILVYTSASVQLTALTEGLFNGTTMIPDTVIVKLHNSSAPFNLVEQRILILNSSGQGTGLISAKTETTSYYLVVKHRNSVETWSSTPQSFLNGILSYDFTTAQNRAYGNNLILKGTKWCFYSGDVNQDGVVDLTDVVEVDVDNLNFVTGYTATDINGDNLVDLSDLVLTDNNNLNFISKISPMTKLLNKESIHLQKTNDE